MPLAGYAMRDEMTQGRRHPEADHPYRPPYQRDRDRVTHSKAFRRLENKTQVFHPDYSDHFRNRLTHTIEVSQISRTVGQILELNIDLCEVLALSHDIGHPPFSHEGERVLDEIMKGFGHGFEHNLHGLRIVEDFEEKYVSFRGLNLTFEVREGIVKHSRDYSAHDATYIDLSEYRPGERPPLEAQLIDFADEIAYNSADLDDGFDSDLLTLEVLVEEVELFRRLYRELEKKYPTGSTKLRVRETVRRIIDVLATSLITRTRANLEAHGMDQVEKIRKFPTRLFAFEDDVAHLNRQLKHFLHRNLYDHEVLKKSREKAEDLIRDLFRHYLTHPQNLPPAHYCRAESLGLERVVCDYIAGMTDKYAEATHSAIFGR